MFDAAVEKPIQEQSQFVRDACAGDPILIAEVESLLASFDGGASELEDSPVAKALTRRVVGQQTIPADSIPGYRILKELHRGGQGVVYQAIQLSTKRKVAMKVMLDGPFAGPASKRRFEREVELVGSLRHPGIVPIFDSGSTHGKYFFVMEYIRGEVLNTYVRNGDLSTTKILQLFNKVCTAMDYAHQKGVIHRDLKPTNILVDERGDPKVVDFGLAKVGGSDVQHEDQSFIVSVTGQIMGTPNYMSPEQAAGNADHVDMRSDVYSLGIVLYELLTGQLPYELQSTVPENLKTIRFTEPRRPRSINRSMSDEAETIVLKAISKERSRRYPTAGALASDITRFLAGDPIEARRDSLLYLLRKSIAKHLAAASILAIFCLLVVVALITGWTLYLSGEVARDRLSVVSNNFRAERDIARELRTESQRQLYFAQMNLASQALSEAGGIGRVEELVNRWAPAQEFEDSPLGWEWYFLNARCNLERECFQGEKLFWSAKFSPDGRHFASGGDTHNLLVHSTDDSSQFQNLATHKSHIRAIAWSADGNWLASGAIDRKVFVFDARTYRKAHTFAVDDYVHALAWHPTQPMIAVGSRDKTVTFWNVETGKKIGDPCIAKNAVQTIDYSVDGQLLAVGTWNRTNGIEIWDTKTRQRSHLINQHDSPVYSVQFSPDGSRLASADTSGKIAVRRTSRLAASKPEWSRKVARPTWEIAWNADGSALASAGDDRLIHIWDAITGDPLKTLEGHTNSIWALDWSPDGLTILTGSHDSTLRLWNANSQSENRVFVPQPRMRPKLECVRWHPAGRNIAVSGQAHEIFIVDQLTGERVQDLNLSTKTTQVDWNSDGSRIAAATEDGVYWWDINEPNTLNFLETHQGHTLSVRWSPDGSCLASCGRNGGILISNIKTGEIINRHRAKGIHFVVAWHPDGQRLATATGTGARVIDLADDSEIKFPDIAGQTSYLSWSPDGSQIAVASDSGMITLHDGRTGEVLYHLNEHVGRVRCVEWNPDGTRLASASEDRTVRVWDTATGTQTLLLRGHEDFVTSVDWSPNGRQLVSVGEDSQIRIWDATRGFRASETSTLR